MNTLLLAAAALIAQLTLASPAAAKPSPVAHPAAEIRLPHISVITLGSARAAGAPIVLIPGLSCPRAVWDGVAAGLARNHRVYLVQVNGFAGDAPGANLKPGLLDGIVADLHTFLASRHSAPVRLVGHSMGGLVGMIAARDHPADVEKLMIVDSLPYFAVLMARGGPVPDVVTVRLLAAQMRDHVAARFGQPLDPAATATDVDALALNPASRIKMRAWAAAADPRVTGQALYEDLTTDLRPALATIATPITIVYPWTDTAFGKDRTTAFYRAQYAPVPHVTYIDIGEAGHFVMLDQPERFAKALDTFVK